jgi:hypothetical protein
VVVPSLTSVSVSGTFPNQKSEYQRTKAGEFSGFCFFMSVVNGI